jgi:hypothetical protein
MSPFAMCTQADDNQAGMIAHSTSAGSLLPLPRHPLAFAVLVVLGCFSLPSRAADHKTAPPAKSADSYPAVDAHPNEHVAIAIDPCDDPKQCSFFRLPYVQHSLIPVRVIITNDSDTPLSLDDARIQFISANGDKIPAATDEDINRRLFTIHQAQGTKIPLIPITIHHPPVDKKITEDENDFGFKGTTVSPHSTLAGYLFYDVKDLDDPAIKDAQIYVKMIHSLDGKKELFAFTILFDKWLAANPSAPSNTTRH